MSAKLLKYPPWSDFGLKESSVVNDGPGVSVTLCERIGLRMSGQSWSEGAVPSEASKRTVVGPASAAPESAIPARAVSVVRTRISPRGSS